MVCARLVGWFEMRGVLDGYMYGCRRLLDRFVFRLAGNEKKRQNIIYFYSIVCYFSLFNFKAIVND